MNKREKYTHRLKHTSSLLLRIDAEIFGNKMDIVLRSDAKVKYGRFFIQIQYTDICKKTGEKKVWHGRKWYLSDHMTDDEIVKTAYAAFEAAVKHEILEGFTVDGKPLFNPHIDFEELLKIKKEVKRK